MALPLLPEVVSGRPPALRRNTRKRPYAAEALSAAAAQPQPAEVYADAGDRQDDDPHGFAALSLMVPPGREAQMRRRTEAARAARVARAASVRPSSAPSLTERALGLCGDGTGLGPTLPIRRVEPGAIATIAAGRAAFDNVKAAAMQLLAMLPGSRGRATERERRWQKLGVTLMASCIRDTQQKHFADFAYKFGRAVLATPQEEPNTMITFMAVNVMWDEASQRMKAALDKAARYKPKRLDPKRAMLKETDMPVNTAVMVVLARMHLDIETEAGRAERWEPWVCPPSILTKANANSIVNGLLNSYPLPLEQLDKTKDIVQAFKGVVLAFGFDSASANLRAYRFLLDYAEQFLPKKVVVLGEPCAMHQVRAHATCLRELLHISWTTRLPPAPNSQMGYSKLERITLRERKQG